MIGRSTNCDDAGEFSLACRDDNGFVDRMRRPERGDTLTARLFRRNPAARSMTARGGSSAPMAMTRPSPITSADPLPKAARSDRIAVARPISALARSPMRTEPMLTGPAEPSARSTAESPDASSMPAIKSPHLSAIAIISDRLAASTCPAITAIPASPAASAFLTVFGPIAGKSTRRSWPGFGRLTSTPRRPRRSAMRRASASASACGRSLPRPRWLRSGRPSRWPPARYRSTRARQSTQTPFRYRRRLRAMGCAPSRRPAISARGRHRRRRRRQALRLQHSQKSTQDSVIAAGFEKPKNGR